MMQRDFAEKAKAVLVNDDNTIGLAVGGSWLTNELDEFSDLDLVLVTRQKVAGDKEQMLGYAGRLGHLLSGFTGEHVGEPRVLICLYDKPLLHVDIKFLTLEEFGARVETPVLLLDKGGVLGKAIAASTADFPHPDNQWIEDRFWIWVHYALLKIGRGEYLEAHDFFGFLRMTVFGPQLLIKNGHLPRGVRKVETLLPAEDLEPLLKTVPAYNRQSLLASLRNAVGLYRELRLVFYTNDVHLQTDTERRVMEYFDEIGKRCES